MPEEYTTGPDRATAIDDTWDNKQTPTQPTARLIEVTLLAGELC
jgi:hypothetical protein